MMNIEKSYVVIVFRNLLKEIEGFIWLKYGDMRNILTFESSKHVFIRNKSNQI